MKKNELFGIQNLYKKSVQNDENAIVHELSGQLSCLFFFIALQKSEFNIIEDIT